MVWNARTGERLSEALPHEEVWVLSAGFSPDGSRLRTVTADGRVRTWPVSGALLQERLEAETRVCLEPVFRQTALGETPVEALERFQQCSARHGRCLDPELLRRYTGKDFAPLLERDAECAAATKATRRGR